MNTFFTANESILDQVASVGLLVAAVVVSLNQVALLLF
jgi:hypothetical protein